MHSLKCAPSMDALSIILIVLAAISFGLLYLSQYKFSYWKKKKVPYIRPVPLLGNYGGYITLKEFWGTMVHKLCQHFPNAPYIGAFYGTEPTLIVKDPELIKLVMAKDFYYFHGREITKYCNRESTTQNIFFNGGDQWKVVRQNMTPLFSSTKLKNMFYLVEQCAKRLETLLDEVVQKNGSEIDARLLASRFTMNSIGSTIFGVETRTLEEPAVNNPFTAIGNDLFSTTPERGLKTVCRAVWPAIFYSAGFKVFPDSIDNFFNDLVADVFKSRGHKPSGRNDFIDLLLNFKEHKFLIGESISNLKDGGNMTVQVVLTDDLLVSQCATMFAAGFETSATTQGFTLYELAKKPEAQKRALAEIDEFLKRHENRLTYDCTSEMPFLEACVDETLRMYPVLPVLTREVIDNYTFPTGLSVDKGVRVHIPVWHIHRHPDYFPEPELYKPERFLPENKQNIKPYTYLPFGEGPRICLGKYLMTKLIQTSFNSKTDSCFPCRTKTI